jgi:two-component system sensor histidine kinase RegB
MAAVAAHKLGTPLSTLSVMLGELEADTPVETEDVSLMRNQIARCKAILAEMVASATPQNRPALSVTNWVNEWVDEWHLLRPSVLRPQITLRRETSSPEKPEPLICPDRTLDQAIQGLLDNAADAVAENGTHKTSDNGRINIEIDWNADKPDTLQIDILDCGPGIPENMADLLGMHFVTTKNGHNGSGEHQVGGLGIGFFLTNATIERFDGKVELFQREPQGTRTRVRLPLNRL